MPSTNLSSYGHELFFDRNGRVAAGDANAYDLDEVALSNMNWDQEPTDHHWLEMDDFSSDPEQIWEESAQIDGGKWIEDTDENGNIFEFYLESRETEDTDEEIEDDVVRVRPWTRPTDEFDYLWMALTKVNCHPLVTEFGFAPDCLITQVHSGHTVAMGFEVLAVVVAACNAANELSRISDDREVAKVLGWTAELPKSLAGFGTDRLFRHAGALQARVQEIKTAPRPKSAIKREAAPIPAPRTVPARPTCTTPSWSSSKALQQRIENGKRAAARLHSIGASQLFERALATRTETQALRLIEDAERMLCACEDVIRIYAESPRPMNHKPPQPACFGSSGKGAPAAQLAKKAARVERDRQLRLKMQGAGGKK